MIVFLFFFLDVFIRCVFIDFFFFFFLMLHFWSELLDSPVRTRLN